MSKRIFSSALLALTFFLFVGSTISAHPGRTDSSGCHTCRTNCEKWGLSYGEYHCHGSKPQEQVYPTTAPTRKPTAIITKSVVKKKVTNTVKKVSPTISKKSVKGTTVKKKHTATPTRKPTAIITKKAVKKAVPTVNKKSAKDTQIKKKATATPKPKYVCNCSKTCSNLSCDEAYFQLNQCGCSARDGDSDGVPCEAQCR